MWPNLDPYEVSRWPEHKTWFYIEWLAVRGMEVEAAQQDASGMKAFTPENLALDGAQVRMAK